MGRSAGVVLSGAMVWMGAAILVAQPVFAAEPAPARITATTPAGLLIMPELYFSASDGLDTEIQLSNTASEPVNVRCYLVNANSHCSNIPDRVCGSSEDCEGGFCLPGWVETDFRFTLTRNQPIFWRVSAGLANFPIDGFEHTTQDGQINSDSSIPPAPENPFVGELKCFEVDDADNPVARNDLIATVSIIDLNAGPNQASMYNAVGLQATQFNDGNDTLCIGGAEPTEECPEPEYAGCPNVLILDHFFEGAPDPVNGAFITTTLYLVPCSEDFLNQSTVKSTLQFLVFNEYEQRFSVSQRVNCYAVLDLADIDTRGGADDDEFSIFSVLVQGTLTGQTRIRPVQGSETTVGHGFVGVAEQFFDRGDTGIAAYQLDHAGTRTQGDIIRAPRE